MTVLRKPLSGILRQPKYAPIKCMQLTTEVSLVDIVIDLIVNNITNKRDIISHLTNAYTSTL